MNCLHHTDRPGKRVMAGRVDPFPVVLCDYCIQRWSLLFGIRHDLPETRGPGVPPPPTERLQLAEAN